MTEQVVREPFDLYSVAIDRDPFPGYAQLREHYPCYWSEKAGVWILTRYEDVLNAAQDWQNFSSLRGNLVDEIPGRSGGTLGTTDPPRHDRLRGLAQAAFARKNLDDVVQPAILTAERALEGIASQPEFDFVSDFSSVVTVETIFRLLGLDQPDPAETRAEVVLSISTDKEKRGRNPQLDAAFSRLTTYIAEEVEKRRANPADDLITKLAEAEIDGDRLSEREVVLTTSMFVVAGVESLSSFMSTFALNLAQFGDARQRLAGDPELIPQAIEESLRYNTSAQRFKRTLNEDVELHGCTLRKGDSVVLAYGAANRDERQFEKADDYDIDRNPRGHLGFGSGKHFCIGSAFARLVAQTAMQRFMHQIPDFELAHSEFDWVPSSNFRSPVTLPLKRLA